jgi:DHA1 family bicyclomycin/chloramphenicol resistance-like MFS transporter
MKQSEKSLRLKTIFLIGGLSMLQPFITDPYLPSLPAVAKDLTVDLSVIQLSLSILTLGFALGQLFAGPLSDSVGRKKPMYAAIFIYVTSAIICAWSPSVEVFFAGRVLQGLSASALTVIGVSVMRDLYSGLPLLKLMGRVMLVGASAWFIAPFAGSALLQFTDWRGISLIVGGYGLLVGIAAIKFMPETLHLDNRNTKIFAGMGKRFIKVLKDRTFFGLMLIQMAIGFSMFAYLGVLPIVFSQGFDVPATSVGLFIAVNSVGAYTGIQVAGFSAKRIGVQWVATGALVLWLLAGVGIVFNSLTEPNLWFVAAMSFMFVFAFGNTATTINAIALSHHGSEAGTAAAVLGTMGFLASTVGGPLYTMLDKESAIGVGSAIAIAMTVALTVMLVVVRPHRMKSMS